jgi:hypothetical protein
VINGVRPIDQVIFQEASHHRTAFQVGGSRLGSGLGRESKELGRPQTRGADNARVTVLVDADDGWGLQPHVDREAKGGERDEPEDERQDHSAVGVRAQHAIVLIVLGVLRQVVARIDLLASFSHHIVPRKTVGWARSLPALTLWHTLQDLNYGLADLPSHNPARQVRNDRDRKSKEDAGQRQQDLFRQADYLYIRFAVDNTTKRAYEVGKPQVLFLEDPQVPAPLSGLQGWQLTDSEAERIESQKQRPLEIIDREVRSARVEPGQETVGVVGVRLPSGGRGPLVIRLVLPNHKQGAVTATVVL